MTVIVKVSRPMDGTIIYELADGRRVNVDERMVLMFGAVESLRRLGCGARAAGEPTPVIWDGRVVGVVPGDFDPLLIRSTSFLYQPRAGDFTRSPDGWIASNSLGPGDLECVPGFEWAEDRGATP